MLQFHWFFAIKTDQYKFETFPDNLESLSYGLITCL